MQRHKSRSLLATQYADLRPQEHDKLTGPPAWPSLYKSFFIPLPLVYSISPFVWSFIYPKVIHS